MAGRRGSSRTREWLIGFVTNRLALILNLVLLAIAALLLALASSPPEHSSLPEHSPWREIIRDVGIAFLVAVIVTAVYELHVRARSKEESDLEIINRLFGDRIGAEVWDEVKARIFEKKAIRRKVDIHLGLSRPNDAKLPEGAYVCRMKLTYDLHGLCARAEPFDVSHALDYHMRCDRWPRYKKLKIDGRAYPPESFAEGKFFVEVMLPPKDGRPVHVDTEREEIVHVPGSFPFVMTELTTEITLHLMGIPESVEAAVHIRPHLRREMSFEVDEVLSDQLSDVLLLPGQFIEFRFKRTAAQPIEAHATAAVTALRDPADRLIGTDIAALEPPASDGTAKPR